MVFKMKYILLSFILILKLSESKIAETYPVSLRTDLYYQNDSLDPRLIGVWIMVMKTVDGQIEYDESIENKYSYNFQKNGNYIIDLRALRSNEYFRDISIVDLPNFKWQTSEGVLEITAYSSANGMRFPNSDKKRYYFKGDTLVRSVSKFEYYYVKKGN
ncbi:hypothetical protein Aconfl_43630 [Algoriphagus confluentis]|uniref:Lipocalin-like domain-containing protein n=1 Tax=Algoriphagus confluentis TaxID=1697556 RepID=A0ABQ6PY77_9BACT|nr:hypothetical protein Aconfl_43630 [Algoriphagus confluentis]